MEEAVQPSFAFGDGDGESDGWRRLTGDRRQFVIFFLTIDMFDRNNLKFNLKYEQKGKQVE